MSDEIKNDSVVEEGQDQVVDQPVEQNDQIVNEDKELYNSLKNDFEEMKKSMSVWQEEKKVYKNQIKGLDRKVSELTSKNKQLQQKEMSAEDILAEKEKELNESYQSLWRDQSIVQDFHFMDEEDRGVIKTFLYGNSYDEMLESEKALYDVFDKYKKTEVEKAVNERLTQGYKPKSSGVAGSQAPTIQDMSKEELAQKAKEVSKMPSGAEKDKILEALVIEEDRRRRALL